MTQVRPSGLESIDIMADKQKELEQKKIEILALATAMCDRHDVLKNETSSWENGLAEAHDMVRRGYYRNHVLSYNGKEAIKELIEQAQENVTTCRTQMREIAAELQKITDQVEKIDDLLARLKNVTYLSALKSSQRERNSYLEVVDQGGFAAEFEAIERNVRRLEYTTNAFLELTSGR